MTVHWSYSRIFQATLPLEYQFSRAPDDLPISLLSRSYMVDLSMQKSMVTLNFDHTGTKMSNAMDARTLRSIALGQIHNGAGTCKFFSPHTGKVFTDIPISTTYQLPPRRRQVPDQLNLSYIEDTDKRHLLSYHIRALKEIPTIARPAIEELTNLTKKGVLTG